MNPASRRALGSTLLLVFLAAGCSRQAPGPAVGKNAVPREVRTATAAVQPMERSVEATGTLLAHEATTLSVKVAGRLHVLAVDLGSVVKPGDLIAQVEPRDYELRVQQAEAALSQARATLGLPLEGDDDRIPPEDTSAVRLAKAVLAEATKSRERIQNLARQGISSSSEQDTVEAAYQVAASRYATALDEARTRQAALAQRRAELELARKQLSDTSVRAPFDGVVQTRIANLGEYVSTGSPVVRLVKANPLRLRLEIPEREALPLAAGQTVRFTLEGGTNVTESRLARLSPSFTEQSRVLVAEADVPNPGNLRAGAFVRAQIVVAAADQGVTVPAEALMVFAGLEKLVLAREGKALERLVTTGRRGPAWIEVIAGLKAGEVVVLQPGNLQTGQPITVAAPKTAATRPAQP
jgi:RND family efflux transporter MFP subunit